MFLPDIEECDIPPQNVNKSLKYIQLIQINKFKSVRVIQCKMEIDRTVKKCGMFSHTMDVENGKYSYIQETSREACKYMYILGYFRMGHVYITGLKSNPSDSRPATLAGKLGSDESCTGSAYSDPYGSWTDVVVLATIKFTLQDYEATVRLNNNRVILWSGVICELGATHCVDVEEGDTYWRPLLTEDTF